MKQYQDYYTKHYLITNQNLVYVPWAVILGWLAWKCYEMFMFPGFSFGDDGQYLNLASSIASGKLRLPLLDGWLRASEYFFLHGIIQSGIMAVWMEIIGFQHWFWAAKAVPLTFGLGTLLFLFFTFRQEQIPASWSSVFLSITAFDAFFMSQAFALRPDMALSFAYLVAIYSLYLTWKQPLPRNALVAGITSGTALLVKLEALTILPTAALVLLFCVDSFSSRIKQIGLYLVGLAFVILPYALWIMMNDKRLDIFLLQFSYTNGNGLFDSSRQLPGTAAQIPDLAYHFFYRLYRLMQATVATFLNGPKSMASWLVLTGIIWGLFNFRKQKARFWVFVLGSGLLTLSTSHAIQAERILMLLPVAALLGAHLAHFSPKMFIRYSGIAGAIILLILIAQKIVVPSFEPPGGLNLMALIILTLIGIIVSLLPRLSQYRINRWCEGILIAFVVVSVFHSAVNSFSQPKNDRLSQIELRRQLYSNFAVPGNVIVTDPSIYPLFPQHNQLISSTLFQIERYYHYWPMYPQLDASIQANAVVLSDSSFQKWQQVELAKDLLNSQFWFWKTMHLSNGRNYYIFTRQNAQR
ncbi:glycosyltransferase family 39 protein [candidate division KSB1 bacterium]|nr:glycosyltransferase family 39 protein [candidate division KSB1 bacterium]